MQIPLLALLPNRVRRNYRGGYLLDQLENSPSPQDGDCPEDWLASTLRAANPGMPHIANEGLAHVLSPTGDKLLLELLLHESPNYYFGADYVQKSGPQLGFLAKLLDSAMRLHVQAHPTAEFARQHLHSPWGKLETYVILALRDASNAYIRLGFQRPPSPAEWRRIILEQDIAAMDACFDPIPIRVGEVWLVPGGLPHAIGEGVLMLEVMEPSDLVVRCEFEREGVPVPPEARFMQSPVDLALQIFDYTPQTVSQIEATYKITPRQVSLWEEVLINSSQTDCFNLTRLTIVNRMVFASPPYLRIGVVVSGQGTLVVDGISLSLNPGVRFLVAASSVGGEIICMTDEPLQILFCSPGKLSGSVTS